MALFRGLLTSASLLGAVLLALEGLVVARTPPLDFFHAGLSLFAFALSCCDNFATVGLSALVTIYIGLLAFVTGWDARPLPLNAVWAVFVVLAPFSSLLACFFCFSSEEDEDEAKPRGQEANGADDGSKKKKKKKKSMKAAKYAAGLILLALAGAFWFFAGNRVLYKLRAMSSSPGPTATSWKGFEPLPWAEAEKKADATLGQMTAQEKYSLLRGSGWPSGIVAGMEPEYGMYTGNTPAIPRLGVPSLNMQDAANGYRTFHDVPTGTTTSWPSLLALGATWDAPLVEEVASAIAVEFRGKGANVLLGPSIQVHRTAWGGRNFEYMSGEDPYLGAVLARAYVRGVQKEGVMAVAKHWAFNEQETNRFEYNVNVDQRTAWELYYPPFEAAVDEGVCAFMCAYNRVNGTHACTNDGILKHDLKDKMGFRGFVQSDWGATYQYGRSVEHGLDQDMPGNDNLFTDTQLSTLRPAAVDEAARRILAAIYRMKLDAVPWCVPPNCISERASNQHTQEHAVLAAKAAKAAVVLLKNEGGILPLTRKSAPRIAVVGPPSDAKCSVNDQNMMNCMAYCGGGSGTVIPGEAVTPLEGIRRRAQMEGITIVPPANLVSVEAAVNAAVQADVVVVVGATSATEFVDRDVIHPGLALAGDVDTMIKTLAGYKKPVIVLMQTPGPVMMPWLDEVQAVANLFLGGEETGTAWGSLLFGDYSPEGKLPLQFPKTLQDTIKNDQSRHFEYTEGMFTSYRNPDLNIAFPFGHGLSYTTFEYAVPSIVKEPCSAKICVSMEVKNTGSRAGREVAQAYMEFEKADAQTPRKIMRGFHKTKVLKPGESEVALFSFTARDLSTFSVEAQDWMVQELAKVHFGASSVDIRHVLPLYEPPPAPPAPKQPPPVAPAQKAAPPPAKEEAAAAPAEAPEARKPAKTAEDGTAEKAPKKQRRKSERKGAPAEL